MINCSVEIPFSISDKHIATFCIHAILVSSFFRSKNVFLRILANLFNFYRGVVFIKKGLNCIID